MLMVQKLFKAILMMCFVLFWFFWGGVFSANCPLHQVNMFGLLCHGYIPNAERGTTTVESEQSHEKVKLCP